MTGPTNQWYLPDAEKTDEPIIGLDLIIVSSVPQCWSSLSAEDIEFLDACYAAGMRGVVSYGVG